MVFPWIKFNREKIVEFSSKQSVAEGESINRDFYSISRYETHGQFQKIKLKLISKIASSRDYKWFWLWGYSTRQIDIPGICEERNYKVS